MRSPWYWACCLIIWTLAVPPMWRPLADPDLWWLDWAGRQVLDGHIPAENGLSWADPHVPWVCHEWLVATLYAAVGLDGVVYARAAVVSWIAVTLGILAYRPRSAWATILALVSVLPLVSIATSERAMAWGLALAGAQLVILRGGEQTWRAPVASLVVALWANVHGSFPVGILTLLVLRPAWAPVGAALTLVNPYGLDLWKLVFDYAVGEGVLGLATRYVVEWRPMGVDGWASGIRMFAVVSFGLVGLADRRARWLAVILVPAALLHARMAAVAGVVLLPWVAAAIERRVPSMPLRFPFWPAIVGLLSAALVAPARSTSLGQPTADATRKTWNDLVLGAWLGVHGVPPFWDARNDCYRAETYRDGVRIALRLEGWRETLQQMEVTQVVTFDEALAASLSSDGWVSIGHLPEVLLAPPPEQR